MMSTCYFWPSFLESSSFSDSNLPCGNICNPLLFTWKLCTQKKLFFSFAITLKRAFKGCAHISKAQQKGEDL